MRVRSTRVVQEKAMQSRHLRPAGNTLPGLGPSSTDHRGSSSPQHAWCCGPDAFGGRVVAGRAQAEHAPQDGRRSSCALMGNGQDRWIQHRFQGWAFLGKHPTSFHETGSSVQRVCQFRHTPLSVVGLEPTILGALPTELSTVRWSRIRTCDIQWRGTDRPCGGIPRARRCGTMGRRKPSSGPTRAVFPRACPFGQDVLC
jgi:hypothetical protein